MELIPAIDIINGQCVRLTKGDYQQKKVYSADPVSMARQFEAMGFSRLHVVDLDGAKARHIVNTQTLRDITSQTSLIVDFGGGVKTDEDLQLAFSSGAKMVTVGSVAVTQPELMEKWIQAYGASRLVLGADVRQRRLSINGWLEDSEQDILPFIRHYYDSGIRNVLCTDIARDGMLSGPSVDLYRDIMEAFPDLHLIASGGVSCVADLLELQKAGIPAVVFGKAIYEGRIQLENGMLRSGSDEIPIKNL
ncbi:MAG: 1-(5-phosphoribosyl)-5-[(5-phosphoribosylamino)methylideneamino]imidazole-4-carboxamide isomerase [Prevotella sp.]|nr:1-(5-phosphoribosyl)-5-[(5-phosphoribosylamino)methylideneamino]imidazole-4-carboxamide isomerase [Prevotella sp.]